MVLAARAILWLPTNQPVLYIAAPALPAFFVPTSYTSQALCSCKAVLAILYIAAPALPAFFVRTSYTSQALCSCKAVLAILYIAAPALPAPAAYIAMDGWYAKNAGAVFCPYILYIKNPLKSGFL
jgi:hypothetical protein